MLRAINPKLPMRDKDITRTYYTTQLGFEDIGSADFEGYLILKRDAVEIHFFKHKDLNVKENYGQVYIRTDDIDELYQSLLNNNTAIHPNGSLQVKPWGQKEFSVLDPDLNLITFGKNILNF